MKQKLVVIGTILVSIMIFSCAVCYADAPSSDYQLLLSDEFDGSSLNTEIWDWRSGEPYGGKNLKENVRVEGGTLNFDYRKVDGYYTGGGVLTNFTLPYGYYETRAKSFGDTGRFHTSFWLSGGSSFTTKPENAPQRNTLLEIDGFEIDSERPDRFYSGAHRWWTDHIKYHNFSYNTDTTNWFTMGVEWLPDCIKYYVNGKLIETDNTSYRIYNPSYLWLTSVAMPEGNEDKIDDSKLPGTSQFDYFKYYQKPLKNVNLLGNGNFEYDRLSAGTLPSCFVVKGDTSASVVINSEQSYDGYCSLLQYKSSAYSTAAGQELAYLCEGKYTFSGMFKSSGGQKKARMVVYDKSGNVLAEKAIPKSNDWLMLTLSDIFITDYAFVSIESDSDGRTYLYADDLQFFCQEGEEYTITSKPDYEQFLVENKYDGSTVLTLTDATDRSEIYTSGSDADINKWYTSNLGEDGSYYSSGNCYATWTFTAPETDDYCVDLYNIVYANNVGTQKYTITVDGNVIETNVVTKDVNNEGLTSGWVNLAKTVHLEEGQTMTIDTRREQGVGGCIRICKLKIVSCDEYTSWHTPAMYEGQNKFIYQRKSYFFDVDDLSIAPYYEGETLYIPYQKLKELLNISVGSTDGDYITSEQLENFSDYTAEKDLKSGLITIHLKEDTITPKTLFYLKDNFVNVPISLWCEGIKNRGMKSEKNQIVYDIDTGITETAWISSGVNDGYISGKKTYYANPSAWMIWDITAPSTGKYIVQIFSPAHATSTNAARYDLLSKHGIKEFIVDQTTDSGWYDFGTFDFVEGDSLFIKISNSGAGSYLRTGAVRLIPYSDDISVQKSGSSVTLNAGYGIYDFPGIVFYAEYDNGILVRAKELTKNTEITFNIPEKNTYKVFFWESLFTMRPLRSALGDNTIE